jgi:hypothetical protein
MNTSSPNCPSCGEAASGHFCANCGALLNPKAVCSVCGKPLASGAHFCHQCGSAVSGSGSVRHPRARGTPVAPAAGSFQWGWLVPGVAVLMLVVFLIAQKVSGNAASGSAPDGDKTPLGGAPTAGPFSGGGGGGAAPDISQMTPEQRADRLFDRVMRYGSEGKQDSARIFAPMAIQAYEMIGTLDTHRRYDIGMIAVIAGDAAIAKAQADTILASNPTHLLGLLVAMKAAGLANKPADRAGFEKRLAAAKDAELAKKLPEYEAHRPDIDAALKTGGKK